MKNTIKVVSGLCLLVFIVGFVSCSDNVESAVINITPVVARDTTVTTDSLTPEEVKMLYKMRTADNRISSEELTKLTESVIGILDEETGLKSGTGRRVGSMSAWVSENSRTVALKSGGDSEIEIPDTLAYVVNFEDSLGFAILAADTRVEQPILGFFDHGTLGDSVDSPNFEFMLKRMENYIVNSIVETEEQKDSLLATAQEKLGHEFDTKSYVYVGVYAELKETLALTSALLPVEWGQGAPYNDKMTYNSCGWGIGGFSPGDRYVVGCVATVYAQLLAYWQPTGQINGVTFDWTSLRKYTARPNAYMNAGTQSILSAPANIKSQIAELFLQLGKPSILSMNYTNGCSYSTTSLGRGISYLRNNLGFVVPHDSIGNGEVNYNDTLVKYSILDRRPVPIRGTSYGAFVGHAWIIDGLLLKNVTYHWVYMDQTTLTTTTILENARVLFYHNNWGDNGGFNGYIVSGVFQQGSERLGSASWYGNDILEPGLCPGDPRCPDLDYSFGLSIIPNLYKP